MPANQIKHDVKEGKGTKESLEKKWDEAKDAAEKSDPDDKWALTNYIYQKKRDASVIKTNAAARLKATSRSK